MRTSRPPSCSSRRRLRVLALVLWLLRLSPTSQEVSNAHGTSGRGPRNRSIGPLGPSSSARLGSSARLARLAAAYAGLGAPPSDDRALDGDSSVARADRRPDSDAGDT